MAWRSKRAKTVPSEKLFQKGWLSGWTSYRYGSNASRHATIAQVLTGERRKNLVSGVVSILEGGRSSAFEYEGAVRAALRSALCLQGHGWSIADAEAAGLLTAAFQRMGSQRPSWAQAQREYALKEDYCARCGCSIPDDLRRTGQVSRYCSAVCAKSALLEREEKKVFRHSAAGQAAYRLIKRETLPAKICKHCGAPYRPGDITNHDQKYCSVECRNASQRRLQPIQCVQCTAQFRPYRSGQVFCSENCRKSYGGWTKSFSLTCTFCDTPFIAKTESTAFCSNRCRGNAAYYRRKVAVVSLPKSNVIYLTPDLFDRTFARPGVQICTADLFDRMFG